MGHSKKISIKILSIISAISVLCLCIYVPETSAKADGGGFQFLYTLSQYEYLHEIDQTDPLYNPNNIRQEFVEFSRFVGWDSSVDYSSVVSAFANYLNSDTTFQALDFEQYNVICFNSDSYTYTDVYVYTSSRPLYVTNGYVYSYELNNSSSFSIKLFHLTYNHDYSSMTNISFGGSSGPQTFGNGSNINGTYFVYSFDNQFDWNRGHVVYSDCPVRFGYNSNDPGLDNSGDASVTANQLFTANEDGFSNYPVLAIDRRTLCPSWVDTSMSPEDRIINENSRCGFDNVYYYISGSPDNLQNNLGYVPNEYLRVNHSHCALKIYFDFSLNGQYEALEGDIETKLKQLYPSKYGDVYSGGLYNTYYYSGANHVLTIPLDDITPSIWNTYSTGSSSYFSNVNYNGVYYTRNGEDFHPTLTEWINALSNVFTYSYTQGRSFDIHGGYSGGLVFNIGSSFTSSKGTGQITGMNFISYVQVVDLNDSTKNSGIAQFTYDCIRGSSSGNPDPVIYDDSDIVDNIVDPDYVVPTHPTTEVDPTQPTTQTVIVDGGKNSIVVTNTNNNTNNPTFNNSPTVNVTVSGGGSDNTTQSDGFVVITDDDEVEYNDVQGVVDDVENFLDFGDTFFDEYIGTLFNTIPQAVWKPFAISSAFIALACMIGYILRR